MSEEQPVLGFWRIAERHPDKVAIIDSEHRKLSYGELAALSNRIVKALRDKGLKHGDQISTVLPNSIEQVALVLAAMQGGFYVSTINFHLIAKEISYIVNDSDTKMFFTHQRFADECAKVPSSSNFDEQSCYAIGDVAGFRPFSKLIEGCSEALPEDRTSGSLMFYTSGTTGNPKGVRRPLTGLDPDDSGALYSGLLMLFGTMPHDDNVHITQAPMYHTAVNNWTISSLHMGHTVVLMDKWTPEDALERYERYKVTHTHMVPTMFHRLLKMPKEARARYDLSSLRVMIHAAAPCPIETKKKMLDWWGDVIWEYYAATEGGGTIVSPQEWRQYPGTVGKAWPTSEVVIFDSEGNQLPTGESGTVYMRMNTDGNAAEFEYHNAPEKTKEARMKGFFTVGDIGYFNEDGYLFLNDRKADMIIAGGVNIYPAEIEAVLHQHDEVADVAVFGVPHEDKGESIMAVIQPLPGVESGEALESRLRAFIAEQLAKQKWPEAYAFHDELPRDPNGKLYKRKLRDPYWQDKKSNIV